MAEQGSNTFEIGSVIKETFAIIRANASALAVVLAITTVGPAFLGLLMPVPDAADPFAIFGPAYFAIVGVSILAFAFCQVAIMNIVKSHANGEQLGAIPALTSDLGRLVPVMLLYLLVILGISIGIVLLIVPGLILLTMWSVAIASLVIEKNGIIASFGRSRALTKGYRWPIFGLLLIYLVVLYGIVFGVGAFGLGLIDLSGTQQISLGGTIFSAISNFLSIGISTVGTAVMFLQLRRAKEGGGTDELASVFE